MEVPGRPNWPNIDGPIGNYGEDWGGVLAPLIEFFSVDPEDSSSGTDESGETDFFSGTSSDSSSGGPSDVAQQPTETESSDDVENNTLWEEYDSDK